MVDGYRSFLYLYTVSTVVIISKYVCGLFVSYFSINSLVCALVAANAGAGRGCGVCASCDWPAYTSPKYSPKVYCPLVSHLLIVCLWLTLQSAASIFFAYELLVE